MIHTRYNDKLKKFDEVSEDFYWNQLECLPPTIQKATSFLVGEPHSHDANGKGLYSGFVEYEKKYYRIGNITIKDFLDLYGGRKRTKMTCSVFIK